MGSRRRLSIWPAPIRDEAGRNVRGAVRRLCAPSAVVAGCLGPLGFPVIRTVYASRKAPLGRRDAVFRGGLYPYPAQRACEGRVIPFSVWFA